MVRRWSGRDRGATIWLVAAVLAVLVADARALPRLRLDSRSAGARAGSIVLAGFWATAPNPSGEVFLYGTVRNLSRYDDLLDAAIVAGSTTSGAQVPGHVHTLQEIQNSAECGEASVADVIAGARQLQTTSDLVVAAHGRTVLAPGSGRLVAQGMAGVRPGQSLSVQLWWDSGSEVQIAVPVRGLRAAQ